MRRGEWVRMRVILPDCPAVARIAKLVYPALPIGQTRNEVLGGITRWFCYVKQQLRDGATSVALACVDLATGIEGMGAAMLEIGWLEDDGRGGVRVSDWEKWFSQSSDESALAAERMRRSRSAKRNSGDGDVAPWRNSCSENVAPASTSTSNGRTPVSLARASLRTDEGANGGGDGSTGSPEPGSPVVTTPPAVRLSAPEEGASGSVRPEQDSPKKRLRDAGTAFREAKRRLEVNSSALARMNWLNAMKLLLSPMANSQDLNDFGAVWDVVSDGRRDALDDCYNKAVEISTQAGIRSPVAVWRTWCSDNGLLTGAARRVRT